MNRLLILLVLPVSTGFAMDPPDIEWIVLYGSAFYDVAETSTGDLIVAGRRWSNYARTLFLYSSDGEFLWEASVYPSNLISYSVIQNEEGDFISLGHGIPDGTSSQTSLSLYKVSPEGDALWSRLFVLPDGTRGGATSWFFCRTAVLPSAAERTPLKAWISPGSSALTPRETLSGPGSGDIPARLQL